MPFVSKALSVLDGAQKYIIAGLIVALTVTNFGWHLTQVSLDKEVLGRKNDRLSFENAQAEATVLAYTEKVKKDADNAANKAKADEDYLTLMRKYNASLLRYQANQRPTGIIDLSSTSVTTDGSNSTSESTSISITMNDASICAENTARIQAVQKWASDIK